MKTSFFKQQVYLGGRRTWNGKKPTHLLVSNYYLFLTNSVTIIGHNEVRCWGEILNKRTLKKRNICAATIEVCPTRRFSVSRSEININKGKKSSIILGNKKRRRWQNKICALSSVLGWVPCTLLTKLWFRKSLKTWWFYIGQNFVKIDI